MKDKSPEPSRPASPGELPLLNESFGRLRVPREELDRLWRQAWRHFGPVFVRYSVSFESGVPQVVQPLRVDLNRFTPGKGHRRILRRNADLRVEVRPTVIDDERRRMFHLHKQRFLRNVPNRIEEFLGSAQPCFPCENVEVGAYIEGRLVAASYLDVGREGASSLYAMFSPEESRRSLGIATMLWEIDYARSRGCAYYYPGYAFHEPSLLDYKKQFAGTEWFDWQGAWHPLGTGQVPALPF